MTYKYPPRATASDTAGKSTPSAAHDAEPARADSLSHRAKFLPRPPAFASKNAPDEPSPSPNRSAAATPSNTPQTIADAAWYEDLRFGSLLIAVVLLLNVALVYAMPVIGTPPGSALAANDRSVTPTEMDSPPLSSTAPITLYAQPDGGTAPAPTDAAKPSLSLPDAGAHRMPDFPPPNAPPLDRSKSMEENLHSNGNDQQ